MSATPSLTSAISATLTAATSSAAASTSSATSNTGGNNNNNQSSSPLLFFVALGFGVVFTNLWIIVGVKYCFRYNARNRARGVGEDGVDLQAMNRPHRRRREKKLMTMDEVNERFPATKYKTWRATREVLGLPTAGGIAPDASAPQFDSPTTHTAGSTTTAPAAANEANVTPTSTPTTALPTTQTSTPPIVPPPVADPTITITPEIRTSNEPLTPGLPDATNTKRVSDVSELDRQRTNATEEEHDDDAVAAVPVEMAQTAGDTCAICIDTIEDTDDVRGLTCGHAFHTGCLDPWLTSRRACCPLCKYDYYVPKPRTETEIQAEEAARERRRELTNETPSRGATYFQRLQTTLFPGYEANRRAATPASPSTPSERRRETARRAARRPGRGATSNDGTTPTTTVTPASRFNPFRRNDATTASTTPQVTTPQTTEASSTPSNVVNGLFSRMRNRGNDNTATPRQLENGQTAAT